MREKQPILDVFYAVHNTNYSEAFFSHFDFYNIFFYIEPAFVSHLQRDLYIVQAYIVALVIFLFGKDFETFYT